MKRLLAYLFFVLGLGLTFNVNANSEEKIYKLEHCQSGSWGDFDLMINLELNTVTKSNQRDLSRKDYYLGTFRSSRGILAQPGFGPRTA